MTDLLDSFLDTYGRTLEVATVHALFTISAFSAISAGLLSAAPVPVAAVAGFGAAYILEAVGSVPLAVLLAFGVAAGTFVGHLLSLPLLRLSSHWIALATIALVLITRVLVLNLTNVTGGAFGIPFPRQVGPWLAVVVVGLVCWTFARLRRSRFGLSVEAVRSQPDVAESLGISVLGVRRTSFIMSGAIAGIAGVLFANVVQYLGPTTFYTRLTFLMLAALVLGGRFHWLGALVGAFVFTGLPELMRAFLDSGENIANGVALVAIMIYMPGGIIEPGRRERRLGAREAMRQTERESEGHVAETEVDDVVPSTATGTAPSMTTTESPEDVGAGAATGPEPSQEGPPLLRIQGLSKRFGGVAAVDDLSATVAERSIFGILGPNGAGKSTLLNLITGLERPDGGQVFLGDLDLSQLSPPERAEAGLARTFQEVRLFPSLTVLENIAVGRHLHRTSRGWQAVLASRQERRERADVLDQAHELMERVGVIGRPDQYAGTLSYANQRRAEIARALAAKPRLLLLDEPTAGMHKLGSEAVGNLLRQLRETENVTIVVIEHNIDFVTTFCDSALVMNFGKLLALGEPRECLARPEVREAYFGNKSEAERLESLIALREH